MPDFDVRTTLSDGDLHIVPVGELDIATADRVAHALAERPDGGGVLLDLSELSFLDTSGIQLIVQAYRDAEAGGYALRVVPAAPRVQRVFEIAGLDRVLPFVDG